MSTTSSADTLGPLVLSAAAAGGSSPALALPSKLDAAAVLPYARQIVEIEAQALLNLARRLDQAFERAVESLFHCRGSVIVTGMGKAGLIGQKIAATLSSTGTRGHYLHPGEAVHGDLGRIHRDDLLLVLSQSGETDEIVRLLPSLAELGVVLVAVTGRPESTLGRAATVVLDLGPLQEACALGLAPSTSTTAMLALGDALALVTSRLRDFRREDFARFHPGGSLGQQLSKVDHHLRPLAQCRVAEETSSVREVLVRHGRGGRRSGAILLVNAQGQLSGIFTDSDLARLFESRRDAAIDRPIHEVMTRAPHTVPSGSMLVDAVSIMAERKISELPVVDAGGIPLGLLDVTDVLGCLPNVEGAAAAPLDPALRPGGPPRPKAPFFPRP